MSLRKETGSSAYTPLAQDRPSRPSVISNGVISNGATRNRSSIGRDARNRDARNLDTGNRETGNRETGNRETGVFRLVLKKEFILIHHRPGNVLECVAWIARVVQVSECDFQLLIGG